MNCLICKKGFQTKKNPNQKVCSRSCNAKLRAKEKHQAFLSPKCKNCGKETGLSRKKFCSFKCFIAFNKGSKHYNWKGGRKMHTEGYIYITDKNHPFRSLENLVLEHRLIMEKWLRENEPKSKYLISVGDKKYLRLGIVVHHKNGRKNDNRIQNLSIYISHAEHIREHALKDKKWFGRN